MNRLLLLFSILATLGCGERERPPGTTPADSGTQADSGIVADAGVETDAGFAADAGGPITPAPCPAATFDTFPLDLSGDTSGASSQFDESCAGGAGPDVAIVWTAPADGFYLISTAGSAFDSVLAVLDGSCGGTELACNDDIDGTTFQSQLALQLSGGQVVTILVDGLNPQEAGAFRLHVEYE